MLPLLVQAALAADRPSVWAKQSVAVAGWPAGLLSESSAEARTPLYRSDSIVFRDTYTGAGVHLSASPAFVIGGPRLSIAPIDVFDVNLKAAAGWYFGNGLGLLPFGGLAGTLDADRELRRDEGIGAPTYVLTAEPTLKAKVWRIIVFDAWTIDRVVIDAPADATSPYVYEPYRDLVIAWEDVTFEQHAGLLYDALPEGGPTLRIGPTYRDRWSLESGDRSATVGLLVAARPGTAPAVPTIVGLALWYVVDTDRVGPMPFLAAQASWELDRPFRPD